MRTYISDFKPITKKDVAELKTDDLMVVTVRTEHSWFEKTILRKQNKEFKCWTNGGLIWHYVDDNSIVPWDLSDLLWHKYKLFNLGVDSSNIKERV